MIIKHPRLIIKQHGIIKNYRYVGDVSILLSQSPKFQQVWVEGLRVLRKIRCSNDGAQQDIRVRGWRWKKGPFIVFLVGWGNLPIGPYAHRLSHPRAHGVLTEIHTTPCARGSKGPVLGDKTGGSRVGGPELCV